MPLVPAKCPECGGLVEVDNEKRAVLCQHCGQPFVIEDAIQTFNTYYQTTNNYNTTHNYGDGAVVNVYEDKNKDFVIEAGVLKEYHGESKDVILPDTVTEIAEGCFQNVKIKSIRLSKKLCVMTSLPTCVKIDIGENDFFEIINGGLYSRNERTLIFLTEDNDDFTIDDSTMKISSLAERILKQCKHLYYNGVDLFNLNCNDKTMIDKAKQINAPFKITKHCYNDDYICEHCGYENIQKSFNISISGGIGISYCLYFDILPNDTIKISCDDFHWLNYSRSVYSIIVESISSYRKELLEYISKAKHIQIASMNIKCNKIDYGNFSGFASAQKQLKKVFELFDNVENITVMCDSIYKIEAYDGEDKGIAVPFWNFEIMKNIKSIDFYDCCVNQNFKAPVSVENVHLSENMIELAAETFADCKNIQRINIPSSVITIGDRCFKNCDSLTAITISKNIKKIGHECFKNCTSLTSIVIHKKIESIGSKAFMGCKSLKEVLLEPPQKEHIQVFNSVFRGCESIISITLPKAYGLSCDIFADCINLEKVIIEHIPIKHIPIKHIPIKDTSWATIPENAFKGCKKLKVVETDKQIEYAEKEAFYECDSLTSININKELHGGINALPKLWKNAGKCSHCGGKFNLFGICKYCGKKKDY